MSLEVECSVCSKRVVRWPSTVRKVTFCSPTCRSEYHKTSMLGSNNPNYGNRWLPESREKNRVLTLASMTPERRGLISQQHIGKKLSEETRKKMSLAHRGQTGRKHSAEAREKIGRASSAKFTPGFKEAQRARMEEKGYFLRLSDRAPYEVYRQFSNWVAPMWDYVVDPEQLSVLRSLGVFNNRKNTRGVVRDHMYSRYSGYTHGVFPELLRHPCNLQVIPHATNVSKARRKSIGERDNAITLSELLSRISSYTGDWFEQAKCAELVHRYVCGNRYDQTVYIQSMYAV